MGALLGLPGQMVEFAQWREEQSVTQGRALNVVETIGGGSFAFRGPRVRRTWQLKTTGARPDQVAGFELLAQGAYGGGPFWLIDPLARVTNVIPPAMSLPGLGGETPGVSGDAVAGGMVLTEDGLRLPSLISGEKSVFVRCDVPLIPGVPFVVSAYLAGSAPRVTAGFVGADGKYLGGGGVSNLSATTGVLKRASGTMAPPAGAVAVYVGFLGASAIAGPAVTYTRSVMPWAIGKGCDRVALGSWDSSYEHASPDRGGRREATLSVTVEEVGAGA